MFFSNIGGQQLRLINNLILPTELTLLPNSPGISKLQQQLQEQDNIHPIIMINNMLMPNNIAKNLKPCDRSYKTGRDLWRQAPFRSVKSLSDRK